MSLPRPRATDVIATLLLSAFVAFWTFWSVGEFYYEGWGTPFPQPLAYLIPCAAATLLAAATLRWPRAMGAGFVLISVVFYAWAVSMNLSRWGFSWSLALSWGAMAATTIGGGVLFVIDGIRRRRVSGPAAAPPRRWWVRHARPLVVFGVPALIAAVISAVQLTQILTRVDDGYRGMRIIAGNGVRLAWAPAGPGWNWLQPWGGYPSWDSLAFYGVPPVGLKNARETGSTRASAADMARTGLCGYLNGDGTALLGEPARIWRMPTADEYVRSLTRRGTAAGCQWNGERGQAPCRTQPQKETPLWAPDQQPIYMWTATEQTPERAWFVNYLGFVSAQPKAFGNPRHGYRCVKAVP